MRYLILLLALVAFAGCCGPDTSFGVRNPFVSVEQPKLVPTGWGAVAPATTTYQLAPVPAAAAPCAPAAYAPAYQYAAPMVPAPAAAPCAPPGR